MHGQCHLFSAIVHPTVHVSSMLACSLRKLLATSTGQLTLIGLQLQLVLLFHMILYRRTCTRRDVGLFYRMLHKWSIKRTNMIIIMTTMATIPMVYDDNDDDCRDACGIMIVDKKWWRIRQGLWWPCLLPLQRRSCHHHKRFLGKNYCNVRYYVLFQANKSSCPQCNVATMPEDLRMIYI